MSKRVLGMSMAALVLVACGKKAPGGGTDGGGNQPVIVDITGTVRYDLSEMQWRGCPTSWAPATAGTCTNGQLDDGNAPDGGGSGTPTCGLDAGVSGLADSTPPCLAGDTLQRRGRDQGVGDAAAAQGASC